MHSKDYKLKIMVLMATCDVIRNGHQDDRHLENYPKLISIY